MPLLSRILGRVSRSGRQADEKCSAVGISVPEKVFAPPWKRLHILMQTVLNDRGYAFRIDGQAWSGALKEFFSSVIDGPVRNAAFLTGNLNRFE